jgi:hypothetical protein
MVVDAKAPDDAAAFKGWLRQISQRVAEAAKEGGLFGTNGSPVSDTEMGGDTWALSAGLFLA